MRSVSLRNRDLSPTVQRAGQIPSLTARSAGRTMVPSGWAASVPSLRFAAGMSPFLSREWAASHAFCATEVPMTKLNRWKLANVVLLLCTAMTGILQAQTFTTLVNFDITNGADPYLMSLVQGPNGNLYGTTDDGGGFAGCGPPGCGTVFEITRNGTLTQLYNFGAEGHGAYPFAGLLVPVGALNQAAVRECPSVRSKLCSVISPPAGVILK